MSGGESPELTIKLQESMLREAVNQTDLRQYVPPVVSLSFGVLPLARRNETLYLACRPDVPASTLPILKTLVPVPIEGLSFDRDVMVHFLRQLNRTVGGVNLPTFTRADFLDDETARQELTREKEEQGVEPECTLAPGQRILLEYKYRSQMANIDDPQAPTQHYQGAMDITFRARDGQFTVFREDARDDDTVLVTRRQFAFTGTEHGWGIGGEVLTRDDLPYVVHPTEIQLRGLHPDRLVFHAYDHDEEIRLGEPGSFRCEYYFLDGGQRQHRLLEVEVIGSWCVTADQLTVAEREQFGDDRDLDLWFD